MRGCARGATAVSRVVWTPERDALLAAELPDNTDPAGLLARLNELPAEKPVASVEAMAMRAHKRGLRRTPEAALEIQRASGRAGNEKRRAMTAAGIVPVWTKERDARLIEGRVSGEASGDTLAALNAMRGQPVSGIPGMRARIKMLRKRGVEIPARPPGMLPGTMPAHPVRRRRAGEPEPTPAPPPKPKPSPELADAAAEARFNRLADAVKRSMKGGRLPWEAAVAIALRHGVTPKRVPVVLGMVR